MKHLIIVAVLVIIISAGLMFTLSKIQLFPESASLQANPIDKLFDLEFNIIAFLFSLIVVFLVYSIIFFRRKPGDTEDADHIEGNTKLEITWTVLPLVTVLILSYLGSQSLADTLRIGERPVPINAIGQQWSWRFEYPEAGVTSTTLVMPVHKQSILKLSSTDVIHSFWVPEFRVKQDALPGGDEFVRDLRITPTKEGEFTVRCAELCGLEHTTMLAPVKVVSQEEFEEWLIAESDLPEDPVERGELYFQQYGCVSCHTTDGTVSVGPTWKDVYCSEVTLQDGTKVIADETYILDSIIDPAKQIVQGFPNTMPNNYGQQLTDAQIEDIIEFKKSLSEKTCP